MLKSMGMSVLSGANTTLGAALCMVPCKIVFFQRFGIIILWTVAQSLLTSLVFFSALMALVGPNGKFGDIATIIAWIRTKLDQRDGKVESKGRSRIGYPRSRDSQALA